MSFILYGLIKWSFYLAILQLSNGLLKPTCSKSTHNIKVFGSTIDPNLETSVSSGISAAIDFLNQESSKKLVQKLCMSDEKLKSDAAKANFWTGGNFVVQDITCTGILEEGLRLNAECQVKGKIEKREILVKFPYLVTDEVVLKNALVQMATTVDQLQITGSIMKLPFGQDCSMPVNFRFNDVPHSTWVRSFLYDAAANAVEQTFFDQSIVDKTRLRMFVNIPEVNPAFDTYRLGTMLEMVRAIVLRMTEVHGKRARVCVQQSLGEGIFTGLPLSLSSMRPVLEKMDWGQNLEPEQKFRPEDNTNPRGEALIRLGTVGADQVADDDDLVIVISPQNMIGGVLVDFIEEMAVAARNKGATFILINPKLGDQPSSNNKMQIRGREDRKAIENSFKDFFVMKLLYPSSGGYMFPIGGMVFKKNFHSPWCVYKKGVNEINEETFDLIGAFDPYKVPPPGIVSGLFTNQKG